MSAPLEIVCTACGAESLLRREPVYEGFKKAGERLTCSACGHAYAAEADVPFKVTETVEIFDETDLSVTPSVFREDEKGRTCRYCEHYTVNPFTQRCGLHFKVVEATDTCGDFEPAHDPPSDPPTDTPS